MRLHNKTLKSNLLLIVKLGFIWGLIEAAPGYVIHILHLNYFIPFLISFGIGLMVYGVVKTNNPLAAVATSFIASLLKMLNLFFIGAIPIGWIINPAIHILLEGCFVAVTAGIFMGVVKNKQSRYQLDVKSNN
ncbi:MAG: hypothetical protein Q4F97_01165 [Bacteroidales bacterium]|nr:hypothetical protein [Bacteroidales bacterium]